MRERPRPAPPAPQIPKVCFCVPRRIALGVAAVLFAAGGASLYVGRNPPRFPWISARSEELDSASLGAAPAALPRCYSSSSPEADPGVGAWRSCLNGTHDSPAQRDDGWELTGQFAFLKTCDFVWNNANHPGPKVPRPYWTWEASGCTLDAVTENKFCRVMEGRKGLLLVGDSLTRLMTTTLASILGAEAESVDMYQDNWRACGGALHVRFMRNDFLDPRARPRYISEKCEAPVGVPHDNTRCRLFATDDNLREFDTLVVNSGAHPREPALFREQMQAAAEALTASMHRLHGEGGAILVVRNTVPGHWECVERMFDGPVDFTTALSLVKSAPEKYSWRTFHGRNYHLEHAFSSKKGWKLLDAYTPTLLRADSHIGGPTPDCLHFCVPGEGHGVAATYGPADHWVTLLYNIILAAKNDQG